MSFVKKKKKKKVECFAVRQCGEKKPAVQSPTPPVQTPLVPVAIWRAVMRGCIRVVTTVRCIIIPQFSSLAALPKLFPQGISIFSDSVRGV